MMWSLPRISRGCERVRERSRVGGFVSALMDADQSTVDGGADRPRAIRPRVPVSDWVFRMVTRGGGVVMLLIMLGIAGFLAYQAAPALRVFGWKFFTTQTWEGNHLGVLGVATGTVLVAIVAILVSFPLAMFTALYICEYAPRRLRR